MMECLCGTEFCYDCGGTLRCKDRGHLRLVKRCYCDYKEENVGRCCVLFGVLCVSVMFAMTLIIWKAGPDFWH